MFQNVFEIVVVKIEQCPSFGKGKKYYLCSSVEKLPRGHQQQIANTPPHTNLQNSKVLSELNTTLCFLFFFYECILVIILIYQDYN